MIKGYSKIFKEQNIFLKFEISNNTNYPTFG